MGIGSTTTFNPRFAGYRIQEKAMETLDNAQYEALTLGDVDTYSRHVPQASFNFAMGQALNTNEATWRSFVAAPKELTKIENDLTKSS